MSVGTGLATIAPPRSIAAVDEALTLELAALDAALHDTLAASIAPATTKVYQHDWAVFTAWCEQHGATALPATPETVARYLQDLARDHAPATLTQHCTAISAAHQAAGFEEPPTRSMLVRKTLSGLRRQLGVAQTGKAPLTVEDLRAIAAHLRPGLIGARDQAILTVGLASGMRRSELVALNVEDLEWSDDGVAIVIRRSKTDQEGAGAKVPIGATGSPLCPVAALRAWLEAAAIDSGPVWRSIDRHGRVGGRLCSHGVSLVVKHYVAAIGRDPRDFGAHSLRAGMATAAARARVEERDIMRQGRWQSTMICRRYIREGDMWRVNIAAAIGL